MRGDGIAPMLNGEASLIAYTIKSRRRMIGLEEI